LQIRHNGASKRPAAFLPNHLTRPPELMLYRDVSRWFCSGRVAPVRPIEQPLPAINGGTERFFQVFAIGLPIRTRLGA
jgi:hypothetical protein